MNMIPIVTYLMFFSQIVPVISKDFDVTVIRQREEALHGVVLIHIDGRWGTINGGNHESNSVICRQLGNPEHEPIPSPKKAKLMRIYYEEPVISNLSCRGDEGSIAECSYSRCDRVRPTEGSPSYPLHASCRYHSLGVPTALPVVTVHKRSVYQQDGSNMAYDPSMPLKVLLIGIAVTFSLVLCLQPATRSDSEQGDDGHHADLRNQTGVAHGFERYHVGSGPSYDPAPVSQMSAGGGMGYRQQGGRAGAGYQQRVTYTPGPGQPVGPSDSGQGRQQWDPPGSSAGLSPRYYHQDGHHGGGRQDHQDGVGFRPGTGTNYSSRPPPNMDVAMEGGATTWPVASQSFETTFTAPHNREQSRVPSAPPASMAGGVPLTMQGEGSNDGMLPPSYDEAVSRSNIRY